MQCIIKAKYVMGNNTNENVLVPRFNDYIVESYNPNKSVRLSNDLFDVSKAISRITSTHALKLIYAIAQIVQSKQVEVVSGSPRIEISMSAVFDYLDISMSNRRHDFLKDALEEIMNKSLHIVHIGKNGEKVYEGASWISWYKFSDRKDRLYIIPGPMAIPLLQNLSQYVSVYPKHYNSLSTSYQLWLYPFLKNKQKLVSFRISIDSLKQLLNSTSKSSYTDSVRGTNTFLRRAIGITISEQAKKENTLAKQEKRMPKFIPWDYVKDPKTGEPCGTLYSINRHTDIRVYARGIKNGRAYTEIEFLFSKLDLIDNLSSKEQLEDDQQDLFSMSIDSQKSTEDREGFAWVKISVEEVITLLNESKSRTIEELVSNNSSLQIRNGDIYQYKEVEGLKSFLKKKTK